MGTNRQMIKLKFIKGTYVLQSKRAAFNQNKVEGTSRLRGEAQEILTHFVLFCPLFTVVRAPIVSEIRHELNALSTSCLDQLDDQCRLSVIIDPSRLCNMIILRKSEIVRLKCRVSL